MMMMKTATKRTPQNVELYWSELCFNCITKAHPVCQNVFFAYSFMNSPKISSTELISFMSIFRIEPSILFYNHPT